MKTSLLTTSRRGFTLIETIVTVGLIAVLAAFVVPTVMQKAGVADPVKVQNDLGAVETAISGFIGDTKGARPSQLIQLTQAVSGTDVQLASADTFTTDQQSRWKGPYLGANVRVGQSMQTGYSLKVNQALEDFDADQNVGLVGPEGTGTQTTIDASGTWASTHARFVSTRLNAVPLAQAKAINELFDGAEDVTASSTAAQLTGRVRFSAATSGGNPTVTLYYLVMPITK